MLIHELRKSGITCACGCGELPTGDIVNKTNGKYYNLYCGMIYRLLVESNRRIKIFANQMRISNG